MNTKDLFLFITEQMTKLDEGKIDWNQAKAQAILAKQANNVLTYELNRVNTLMKLSIHNDLKNDNVELRDIEK